MRSRVRLGWKVTSVVLAIAVGSAVACSTRRPIRVEGSGEQRVMLIGPRAPIAAIDSVRAPAGRWTSFEEFTFEPESAEIRPSDRKKVSATAAHLKENPLLQVAIDGSFDRRGTDLHDPKLRDRRVDAIRDALIEAGVEVHRIRTGAFGDPRLRRDRRVEVLVGSRD